MADETKKSFHSIWNVPNILTFARIVISIALFAVMPFGCYRTALILFLVGSFTDFLDGWWARRFHQVTKLGRIADPFADKLLVCGTLIYLAAIPELRVPAACLGGINIGLAPWIVVVIVSRELLVTMLRAMIEAAGGNFSAKWAGKLKMACQCFAIMTCFLYLITQNGVACPCLKGAMVFFLWATVYLTLDSCVKYIRAAIRASRSPSESSS